MAAERLQKIIAAAGVASRRKAEQLITAGLVQVNGTTVTELGTKADPDHDHIRVNGKLLQGAQRQTYLLLNKPKGFVTTAHDPEGRPTVMTLVHGVGSRVYPVGRLDYASEGLLLMTNDGDLAHKLMKAASHVPKTYVVKVAGKPPEESIEKLRRGLSIATDDGKRVRTSPAKIRVVKEANNPWYEVTLIEGRNRQIRRMFEEIGHHVEKIKRVKYGPLTLDVPPGEFRRLTLQEIAKLKIASTATSHTIRMVSPRPAFAKPAKDQPAPSERRSPSTSNAKPIRSGRGLRSASNAKPNRSERGPSSRTSTKSAHTQAARRSGKRRFRPSA
jgi:23S rRNA pseudouridine2605 synthase